MPRLSGVTYMPPIITRVGPYTGYQQLYPALDMCRLRQRSHIL